VSVVLCCVAMLLCCVLCAVLLLLLCVRCGACVLCRRTCVHVIWTLFLTRGASTMLPLAIPRLYLFSLHHQNCHLGLPFMERLELLLKRQSENQSPDFRLFITAEPHTSFPIALLQMCTKVTNEPPAGLRAGLLRSYTVIVDQGQLERVDTMTWRQLVYVVCFLHSVVQERRKFGALGWNIPYEFNNSDLQASLVFLEKHLYQGNVSWPTVQCVAARSRQCVCVCVLDMGICGVGCMGVPFIVVL